MRKHVVVLGSNFGGLTAALAVKHELHGDVDVTVISPSGRFVFNPSLIWLPFGARDTEHLSFPVEPTLAGHDIEFVHESATAIDPEAKQVHTLSRSYDYDYLIIATGYQNNLDAVPGVRENAVTITTLPDALRAGRAWQRFLDHPGDIVVAASQGASCFGAAYEFLFNTAYRVKKAGLRNRVKLHYVSAEPFLGHFGIGGLPHGEFTAGPVHAQGAHRRPDVVGDRPRRRGCGGAGRRHRTAVGVHHGDPAVRGPGRDPEQPVAVR